MALRYLFIAVALASLVACTTQVETSPSPTATVSPVASEHSPTATATTEEPTPSAVAPTANAESTTTITGTALDVSLSARVIMLSEPVRGFDVIAVTEDTRLLSAAGEEIPLQAFRRGMTVRAAGRRDLSGALLASEVQLVNAGTATPTAPPPCSTSTSTP